MDKDYNHTSERALCTMPADTPEEVRKLEKAIQTWIERTNQHKAIEAAGWFTNLSFLAGNHFTRFSYGANPGLGSAGPDTDTWSVRPLSVTKDRFRMELTRQVDNQLLQPHEEFVSLLAKAAPEPYVRPNSGKIEDRDAARIAEIAYKVHWETVLDMPTRQRDIAHYLSVFGNCAVESNYEETDVPIERPKLRLEEGPAGEEDEIFGEAPLQVVQEGTEVTYTYSETVKVWTPFHYSPNPSADHTDGSIIWFMRHSIEDPEWIKEKFGETPEDAGEDERYFPQNAENFAPLKENDPLVLYDYIKEIVGHPERLYSTFGYNNRYMKMLEDDKRCMMTVIHCRPNKHFPKGRTMISAGGKLLYVGPATAWSKEYPERWLAFSIDRYNTLPGKFWGSALMEPLIPLQKQINSIDGIKRIHRHFLAIGQYMVQEGSMSAHDTLDVYPGKIWKYKGGYNLPVRVPNDNPPTSIENDRTTLVQAIRNKSRINEILNTQSATSNIRSGSMIQLLQNEKVESRSHVFTSHQEFLQKLARNILIDISINLKQEDPELTRKIRIAAREYSGMEIESFTGADLRDNIHIRIDIMPSLLTSPEAEQQKTLDYIGVMGGAQFLSPDEIVQIRERLDFDKITNAQSIQQEAAERMLASIRAGDLSAVVVDPNNQDPAIFLNVFSLATLEPSYKTLPMEVKAVIQNLGSIYQQIYVERQQAFLQQQMAMGQLAKSGE